MGNPFDRTHQTGAATSAAIQGISNAQNLANVLLHKVIENDRVLKESNTLTQDQTKTNSFSNAPASPAQSQDHSSSYNPGGGMHSTSSESSNEENS
jgi:hypothetical protein